MTAFFFKTWRFFLILAIAVLTGWAIYQGIAWIPLPVIVVGGVFLFLTRKKEMKEKVDERTYDIAQKASLFVFRVFTVVAAGTGITLLALGRGDYPDLEPAGLALAYGCCALLLLYYSAYLYYNGKLGGKE